MKILSIPSYVDHDYLQAIVKDYESFLEKDTNAWVDHSCLKSINGQELMRLFLSAYAYWKKRNTNSLQDQKYMVNNQFDLFPLLCQIAYTLEELARFDISYNDQKLQLTLNTSIENLIEYLSQFSELRQEIAKLNLAGSHQQQAV